MHLSMTHLDMTCMKIISMISITSILPNTLEAHCSVGDPQLDYHTASAHVTKTILSMSIRVSNALPMMTAGSTESLHLVKISTTGTLLMRFVMNVMSTVLATVRVYTSISS